MKRQYPTYASTPLANANARERRPHRWTGEASQRSAGAFTEAEALHHTVLLKALADPIRLRVLHMLCQMEGRTCVGELQAHFVQAPVTMEHHLRVLRVTGLIQGRRRGREVYYSVCQDRACTGPRDHQQFADVGHDREEACIH